MNSFGKATLFGLALTFGSAFGLSVHASSALSLETPTVPSTTFPTLAVDTVKAQPTNLFASAQDVQQSEVLLASTATSCSDPRPWYRFSGIEALTCLFSGQW